MKIVGVKFKNNTQYYNSQTYFYKCLDDNVQIGDYLVVDTPKTGLNIVKVFEVVECGVVGATKYTVCKVDLEEYNEIIKKEQQLKDMTTKFENMMKKINEIDKYKTLLDRGFITEEEYNLYKSLLNC